MLYHARRSKGWVYWKALRFGVRNTRDMCAVPGTVYFCMKIFLLMFMLPPGKIFFDFIVLYINLNLKTGYLIYTVPYFWQFFVILYLLYSIYFNNVNLWFSMLQKYPYGYGIKQKNSYTRIQDLWFVWFGEMNKTRYMSDVTASFWKHSTCSVRILPWCRNMAFTFWTAKSYFSHKTSSTCFIHE